MSPNEYFLAAQEHYEAGRYLEATAAAAMCSASAALASSQPSRMIHRGDHVPSETEWCGKCYSTKRRYVRTDRGLAGKCRCHLSQNAGRVRSCRHCYADLERDAETRLWVDVNNRPGCPKAPDPNDQASDNEADLNRDEEWAEFLQHISGHTLSAEEIIDRREFNPSLPVTRYGVLPSPRQLDAWLRARAGEPHNGYVIRPAGGPPEAPRFRFTWTKPAKEPEGEQEVPA
ncbi:hypothetical protein [Streptomyces nigrescens]|uniref:hypothetical protein n=1 Tax=Streptomyces nigrescens TaxID=1920 RepID=UPI0036F60670